MIQQRIKKTPLYEKIKAVYGKPLANLTSIPLTPELLKKGGEALVRILSKESRDYFKKRGWSGRDPNGGPPIWDSFSYVIKASSIQITSSFYGMNALMKGDIPAHRMPWLTQEAKDANPQAYALTPREKDLGMSQNGRLSRGERLPLVIPMEGSGGVVFVQAPMTLGDAWVHPGIARFVFMETALKMWRKEMAKLAVKAVVKNLPPVNKKKRVM